MESAARFRRRVGWLTLVVVVILGLGLYAVLGRSTTTDSADALRALPEASLVYPGSEVIASGGRNPSTGVDGRVSAAAWQFLGVDADPAAIEAFYANELAAQGWAVDTHTSSGLVATGEMVAHAWSKNGVIFRLGIRDPESWRADPELFSRYESLYDARLISDRRQDD
jgi:hypothetical protein